MRRASLAIALLALAAGCRTPTPIAPIAEGDGRPEALLAGWRAHTEARRAVQAFARFAVDAPGAGVSGRDLSLRSKQRMWLARPAQLRVEVLGFLDTTLAVLVTDGDEYALLQTRERRFEQGPVYDGFLWDAARLDLSPEEAVEVILGAPRPDLGLARGAAYAVGDRVRIELVDAAGRVRRVVEFGPNGELRRLVQSGAEGETAWEASFDDYVEIDGSPFARIVAVDSGSGRAELVLRDVELNPAVSPDIFRLHAPAGFEVEPGLPPAVGPEGPASGAEGG